MDNEIHTHTYSRTYSQNNFKTLLSFLVGISMFLFVLRLQ